MKASNGGHRAYATRPRVERTADGVILDRKSRPVIRRNGRPVKDWSDPRACPIYTDGRPLLERHPKADRVPVLDKEARRRLTYGLRVAGRPGQSIQGMHERGQAARTPGTGRRGGNRARRHRSPNGPARLAYPGSMARPRIQVGGCYPYNIEVLPLQHDHHKSLRDKRPKSLQQGNRGTGSCSIGNSGTGNCCSRLPTEQKEAMMLLGKCSFIVGLVIGCGRRLRV